MVLPLLLNWPSPHCYIIRLSDFSEVCISPDQSAFWSIFSARIFRAILRAENPTGFHVYTNSGFSSWNIPTHLKFLKKKFFHICILPFFFESHWFSVIIIVCVEGAQQKCAASRFCPLMMTAPYCGPPTHRPPDIFHFYIQGVSKKIVHSDFCFMCVLKLQFYLFTCDLELEFWACEFQFTAKSITQSVIVMEQCWTTQIVFGLVMLRGNNSSLNCRWLG